MTEIAFLPVARKGKQFINYSQIFLQLNASSNRSRSFFHIPEPCSRKAKSRNTAKAKPDLRGHSGKDVAAQRVMPCWIDFLLIL